MAQIGTIRVDTQNNGTVSVPVFNTGDSGSSVYEFVRVETASGTGFIPVTNTTDATYPYLRVHSQNNGTVAVTDYASTSTSISAPSSGVARYTFDDADTSGSTAVDVWNGNDATINGATTGVSGANQTYTTNEAYDFDGVDDNVNSSVADISTCTVAAWANLDTADTENREVFSTRNSASGLALRYSASSNGAWDFYTANDGSFTTVVGSQASTGTWIHLTGVADDNNSITLYENGSEVATAAIGSRDLGLTYRVGERAEGGNLFDGQIDDPRLYDKALSSTEVSNLYNNGSI